MITYENTNNEYSTGTSRYQILRVIREDGKDRYLETYNQVKVPQVSDDLYHVVEPQEEHRLDIIANNYYGSPTYWWALALANNLIDPFQVYAGVILRIPSLMELSDYNNEILTRRS